MKKFIVIVALATMGLTACALDPEDPYDRAAMSRQVWDSMTGEEHTKWCDAWNTDPDATADAIERKLSIPEAAALVSILYTEC